MALLLRFFQRLGYSLEPRLMKTTDSVGPVCLAGSWRVGLGGLACSLLLALTQGGGAVQAASPETAPPQLVQRLTQLDAIANARNLPQLMQFYGTNFSHSDGLNRQTLEQSLANFWKPFGSLKYRTELKSWEPVGSALLAETVTTVTGTKWVGDREFKLTATLRSRQRFENEKIIHQDILSEQSLLTSGIAAPTVNLVLPDQVKPGQEFAFDAIVQEPLGEDFLLGAALNQPVQPDAVISTANLELELLPGGGLFKIGRAPVNGQARWISAVVIGKTGMTLVTRRLPVTGRI